MFHFAVPSPLRLSAIFTILYGLLWSAPSWAKFEDCELRLGPTPIRQKALAALYAAREHFEFSFLSKTINGQPRLVILAGETHVKSQEANDVGLDLLDQFALRGLEGANVSDNLPAKILGKILMVLNSISIRAFGQAGSTIHDAVHVGASTEADSVNLHLEHGHLTKLREKLSMIQFILALTTPAIIVAGDFLVGGGAMWQAFANALTTHAGYVIIQVKLADIYAHHRWFSTLFPLHNALLEDRNDTMALNIVEGLKKYPNHDHMLVLVGSAHVPGLETLLTERYGFSLVYNPVR